MTSYGGNTQFIGRVAGGTKACPTDTTVGIIFAVSGRGFANSVFTSTTGLFAIRANQCFTATAEGTFMDFATTPNCSTTRAEAMRISDVGNLKVGGTVNRTGCCSAEGTKTLSLYNGTTPAGTLVNGVSLFSKDVCCVAHLFAMDEAGNEFDLTV